MTKKHDGGPAFPTPTPDLTEQFSPGTSLRDWFAGQVLAHVVGIDPVDDPSIWYDDKMHRISLNQGQARRAYQIADAMLAARKDAQ